MKSNNFFEKLKFVSRIWSILVYLLLFVAVSLLFAGRKSEDLRVDFLLDFDAGFYSHISNFVISFYIVLASGFIEILATGKMKGTCVVAFLLLLINFVYEWFVPILNTMDKIDAYYGFAGSLLPLVFLYFFMKYGIRENPLYKKD